MITTRDIELYKEERYAKNRKPATINRELTYLDQALRLAQDKEFIAQNYY